MYSIGNTGYFSSRMMQLYIKGQSLALILEVGLSQRFGHVIPAYGTTTSFTNKLWPNAAEVLLFPLVDKGSQHLMTGYAISFTRA